MAILTPKSPFVRPTGEPEAVNSWQKILKASVREIAELCEILHLPVDFAQQAAFGHAEFPLFVPRPYLRRIRPGDPQDPLLLQVLPRAEEALTAPGFSRDPVAENQAVRSPGLLQKYAGRALLVTTGACAIHCRYCFRRHFAYEDAPHALKAWQPALEAIRNDPTLHEVILSGGDPLTLVDSTLAALVEQIATIEHVERLRVHTRLPIMIPERVTEELLAWLTGTRLTPVVVLHINHANEFDAEVLDAIHKLKRAGISVMNQAVLLRGINDTYAAQYALWNTCANHGILAYYLHLLDRVEGAAHFEVEEAFGKTLVDRLRANLSGYAVPKIVREIPGELSKVAIG